jgi:uncharacterized SAM-binding protein YcdF (DUF218 family)
VLFVACTSTPAPNLAARWLSVAPNIEPAEAIVVLGADVNADGALGSSSLRRAIGGIVLYRDHLAPLLVFLGTGSGDGSEALVRARLAGRLGLRSEDILTHAGARTTREEAQQAAALLHSRGIKHILLVTDSRHMRRAAGVFGRSGFTVRSAPTDDLSNAASNPEDRLQLSRTVAQQALALLYYRIRG